MAENIPCDVSPFPRNIPADLLPTPEPEHSLSSAELAQLHRVAGVVTELACNLPAKQSHPIIGTISRIGQITNLDRHGRCWGYDVF